MKIQMTQIMQDALSNMIEGNFEQVATILNDNRDLVTAEIKK